MLVAFGWTFLQDPSISARRAIRLVHVALEPDDARLPGLIAGDWGPFSMFGGGYRVSVP
jgi:hypothetical protein